MEDWEPERKTALRKCSKALAPILDIIRKNAAHASLKAVDAGNAPHDAAPSLSRLEAPRGMLGLAAAARGAPFLARGVVSSRRKTSRTVIARTIID